MLSNLKAHAVKFSSQNSGKHKIVGTKKLSFSFLLSLFWVVNLVNNLKVPCSNNFLFLHYSVWYEFSSHRPYPFWKNRRWGPGPDASDIYLYPSDWGIWTSRHADEWGTDGLYLRTHPCGQKKWDSERVEDEHQTVDHTNKLMGNDHDTMFVWFRTACSTTWPKLCK